MPAPGNESVRQIAAPGKHESSERGKRAAGDVIAT